MTTQEKTLKLFTTPQTEEYLEYFKKTISLFHKKILPLEKSVFLKIKRYIDILEMLNPATEIVYIEYTTEIDLYFDLNQIGAITLV